MAFAVRNLSVLAYANGFTLWHYKGNNDELAEISSRGFFATAINMMAGGDILIVSAVDGASVLTVARGHNGLTTAALA